MRINSCGKIAFLSLIGFLFSAACQPQTGTTNANLVNANASLANSNLSNAFANNNTNSSVNAANTGVSSSAAVETKEPEQYAAQVKLKFEAMGDQQSTSLPAIGANVARNGADRRMEFALPNGEKIVYLSNAATNYVILPNRKQYAELNQESLGFEVRRMLLPEQIVQQVKNMPGVQRIGEENVGGRQVVKYSYSGTANTQTQAGKVDAESYILVDKETGLPLRSETVSQSQTGANVQGYRGFRLVTEMSDIKTTTDPALFAVPSDYQKVEAEQVRAQANLIFNVVATFLGQMMKSAQPSANPPANPASSPTASPAG